MAIKACATGLTYFLVEKKIASLQKVVNACVAALLPLFAQGDLDLLTMLLSSLSDLAAAHGLTRDDALACALACEEVRLAAYLRGDAA